MTNKKNFSHNVKYQTFKSNKKQDGLIQFIHKLVKWLGKNLTKSSSKELNYALQVTDKILTILITRGKPEAIKYSKDLRLKFLTHILSIDENFKSEGQSYYPKFFKPIIQHIEDSKSYPFIRLIFSCLYISRFIRLEPKASFKTITDGPGYTGFPSDLQEDMREFLKGLGVNTQHLGKVPQSLRFKTYHMSSKSGPNGHALWTSYLDYMALSDETKGSIRAVGGELLSDLAERFHQLYLKIPFFFDVHGARKGTSVTRRLVVISDKEGKSREVAILDYWSQAALKPLHNFLQKQLSRISQDCTNNQTKRFKYLKTREGNSFHSVDLSSATDRFPIAIQKELFSIWFGENYANHWSALMVGSPFIYNDEEIFYRTGNPMGAYSSFNSFAICHHFFIFLACKKAKVNWKRCQYMLLGDDIVIADDAVALEYKLLLSAWDIPFNEQKTHTSLYGFEFAKQVRVHGRNVSPFPLSALIDRRTEAFTCLSIICSELWYKDWNVCVLTILEDYYINCLGWARPKWRKLKPKVNLVVSLLSFLKGRSDLGTAVKQYVADWAGKEFVTLPDFEFDLYGRVLALKTVHSSYLESIARITNKNDKRPLGQLATDLVISITSLEDGGADCFDMIQAVPFLQIYGQAEEIYLGLETRVSVFQIGESPKKFRDMFHKISIPLADENFYIRQQDIIIHQCLRAANQMIDMIKSNPVLDFPEVGINVSLPWRNLIKKAITIKFSNV